MTVERKVTLLFAVNAVINWVVSLRGIVDPVGAAAAFGGAVPAYPSVPGCAEAPEGHIMKTPSHARTKDSTMRRR